ncbi:MAG: 50S ribosomal protein L6 [Deltaproteobacteria bacterium]|nr:50S ribosomal protein L6 [Deltaproteobacteria bacterium]
MARIGKKPVVLPQGVTATLEGRTLTVKGKKATLTRSFEGNTHIGIAIADGCITVSCSDATTDASREQGLVRALIQNMVTGVDQGFTRDLEITGVGYRAELKGKALALSLGFSHSVSFTIPEGITIAVDKQTRLVISGADRYLVGETASRIRRIRPPEPYKGKGVRYGNEVIRRKAGKSAVGAGAKAAGG